MKYVLSLALGMLISSCTPAPNEHSTTQPKVESFQAEGVLAGSLPDIAAALAQGKITSVDLVAGYLARIDAIDKHGPSLHAVLSLNPDALTQAKQLDELRAQGKIKGALHGVPILLKDNIESLDNMPTTAGALALKDNITGRDSPLVAGLRAQGAIILGKTNLSQWANFRSENAMSGWSALGGQVRNPHMLDRNPCGSSSGSGAAAAASLAAATVGTETNGSIICPSNANGIVGFKPTVGLVSQQYIVPISVSQDTAGPMTKTVKGAAMMLNAMATATADIDYTQKLTTQALVGVRVGVLHFAAGESSSIKQLFQRALQDLEAAGAILVNIDQRPSAEAEYGSLAYDLLKFEFKDGINHYLASTSPEQVSSRNLQQLITYNQQHADIELSLFDQSIFIASQQMDSLDSEAYQHALYMTQHTTRQQGIDRLLGEYDVAILVAPSGPVVPRIDPINGDVWPNDWPGFGSYAARAGYPHITVPMGDIHALSVGLSMIGAAHSDADILAYAYAYEQKSKRLIAPQYLKQAEDLADISAAMNATK